MTTRTITLVDAHRHARIDVTPEGGQLFTAPGALQAATGWQVKPEGFCMGDVCVPAGNAVDGQGRVDLVAFAARLGRPIVVDLAEEAVSIGAAAADRAQVLQSLEAPDFALPDLSGVEHRLSQYRGKKILLASYASW